MTMPLLMRWILMATMLAAAKTAAALSHEVPAPQGVLPPAPASDHAQAAPTQLARLDKPTAAKIDRLGVPVLPNRTLADYNGTMAASCNVIGCGYTPPGSAPCNCGPVCQSGKGSNCCVDVLPVCHGGTPAATATTEMKASCKVIGCGYTPPGSAHCNCGPVCQAGKPNNCCGDVFAVCGRNDANFFDGFNLLKGVFGVLCTVMTYLCDGVKQVREFLGLIPNPNYTPVPDTSTQVGGVMQQVGVAVTGVAGAAIAASAAPAVAFTLTASALGWATFSAGAGIAGALIGTGIKKK